MKPRIAEPLQYEVRMQVPFHDLDPMQIVWHGNYIKYFDIARHGLFQSAGIDLKRVIEETGYAFPVIRSSVKHIRPLRYREVFLCRARLVEISHKLVMEFEIRRADDGELCATGTGEQAAVKYPDMKPELSIPEVVRSRLAASRDQAPGRKRPATE